MKSVAYSLTSRLMMKSFSRVMLVERGEGSKLVIEGSKLNSLKYYMIRVFIDRVAYGDVLFLNFRTILL